MLRGFYLTLLIGPKIPVPAPQAVIDALLSAQVTTSASDASGFQLTFALSKNSPLNTLMLPLGAFDPGIRVILVATINSLPTVLMDGIITQHTVTPSNDPGQSTLTVTGQDLTVVMSLKEVEVPWEAIPTAGVVNLILASYAIYGIIPAVVPPIEDIVDLPMDRFDSQMGTDLDYIKGLAAECGYVFYIDPGPAPFANVAYFGPQIRVGVPQSALNVNMDSETNVESISFTNDGMARDQLTVTIMDPITGTVPIPIPIPDVSLLRPPLAVRPAIAMKKKNLEDVANLDPVRAALLGLSETVSRDPITASGQLDVLRYGQPLKARQLVSVRGAGAAYDGLYYVTSVTHNIKRGEYKQSFNLGRDGLISLTPAVVP
jgi:hypothetical protein